MCIFVNTFFETSCFFCLFFFVCIVVMVEWRETSRKTRDVIFRVMQLKLYFRRTIWKSIIYFSPAWKPTLYSSWSNVSTNIARQETRRGCCVHDWMQAKITPPYFYRAPLFLPIWASLPQVHPSINQPITPVVLPNIRSLSFHLDQYHGTLRYTSTCHYHLLACHTAPLTKHSALPHPSLNFQPIF